MSEAPGTQETQREIREHYGEIARTRHLGAEAGDACCTPTAGSACCGGTAEISPQFYTAEEMAALPDGAFLSLGTGVPTRYAKIQRGETVLDLGSGAGVDVFLASRAVGPTGRAIGVDFTPAMVQRARTNARVGGYANVEFLEAPLERIPLPDSSVDVIISNCVINLSVDKPAVLSEAKRVLRPGGRFVVSDALRLGPGPASDAPSCDCTTGALSPEEWVRALGNAGFHDAAVMVEGEACCGEHSQGRGIVRAVKA
jgi:arsenite methyltransferase